jgi:hypothetical protein
MDALIEVALAVLEDAIKGCGTENASTAEILLALGFLKSQLTIIRRFDEFRKVSPTDTKSSNSRRSPAKS